MYAQSHCKEWKLGASQRSSRKAEALQNHDRRMLRYMAGVPLANGVASVEVVSRCGVKSLALVVPESRMEMYGHVKRWQGDEVLREVIEVEEYGTDPEVDGRRRG